MIFSVKIFKSLRVFRGEPFNNTSSQRHPNQLNMTVLHTSQNVMEADTLLNEANRKLDQSRDALGPGSYEMAQGWLEM